MTLRGIGGGDVCTIIGIADPPSGRQYQGSSSAPSAWPATGNVAMLHSGVVAFPLRKELPHGHMAYHRIRDRTGTGPGPVCTRYGLQRRRHSTDRRNVAGPDPRLGRWRGYTLGDLYAIAGVSHASCGTPSEAAPGNSTGIPMQALGFGTQPAGTNSLPVRDVAMPSGFNHLGKFAKYYQDRFGESP